MAGRALLLLYTLRCTILSFKDSTNETTIENGTTIPIQVHTDLNTTSDEDAMNISTTKKSDPKRNSRGRILYSPFGGVLEYVGEAGSTRPLAKISIRDAECYSSESESSFSVFLGALSFSSRFVGWEAVRNTEFTYNNVTHTRTFSSAIGQTTTYDALDECFEESGYSCVPRADVIFIRFESDPDDPWAIDQINVDISIRFGDGADRRYTMHYEHAVLVPCTAWLSDRAVYQIGPRSGLFIQHPYNYIPRIDEFIRDWI